MINIEDQNELFKLIAKYLEKDVSCVAIGGTAMMFLGYKNTTKDIDLVFENFKDRNAFVKAIKKLGYKQKSLAKVYSQEKLKIKASPVMFTRGEERFDLFVKSVFGFNVEVDEKFIQRNDFIEDSEFIIYVLPKEYLILLKAITDREKDLEDILTIVKKEDINWDFIVDEAIKQKKKNSWLLLDLEKVLQEVKKVKFIKKKYFDKIYANS